MDVIEGYAPFVLTMTLEYSPDDTESFALFVNGVNSSEQCDKVYKRLVAACPDNWEIK